VVYLIRTMFICEPELGEGGRGALFRGRGRTHTCTSGRRGGGVPYFGGQRQFLLGSQTVKISFL